MIKVGDILPNINLRSVSTDGIRNFNLHENFIEKKILLICIPGAFSSTCHFQHLPSYIKGADNLIHKKRIDQICCITTNDPYVLEIWRESLGSSKIIFLSDGNLEFLKKTKLSRNYVKSFMGDRLIRSIILIDNLKVTKIIIEQPGVLKKTNFESVFNAI